MECPLDEVKTPQFYIASKSSPAEERNRVLKYGNIFGVFDRFGDIEPGGLGEEGIFFEGTRFLSELSLFIGNNQPMLLSSTIREDNSLFTADLTNVDITRGDSLLLPRGTLHVARLKTLWRAVCYEELRISNYGLGRVEIPIAIQYAADFADLFEVRGQKRARRGQPMETAIESDSVVLSYRGLDGVMRYTRIHCCPVPASISSTGCRFNFVLEPKEHTVVEFTVACRYQPSNGRVTSFGHALHAITGEMRNAGRQTNCYVHSSSEQFNDWVRRSAADIQMMVVGNPEADYPYAGVPWFSTVFGRDGIITALQCLWLNPQIARGVLRYLADTQAQEVIPECDAEPGKILHEARRGEMAALKEIPFGRYYGAVDSTPLFVMLAGAYFQRTNDLEFIRSIWPHVQLALEWCDTYGDRDRDGFVEYARISKKGLVQQGWKDSNDSIFRRDGSIADPPIALCEVQGYVYAAKRYAAQLARALGDTETAAALQSQAEKIRVHFEEKFWCPEIETYALALDGQKEPCRVRASNAGHCLYTQIANPERAALVTRTLLSPPFFTGWGVRTVASTEARYNPVSYHNGSIWPHDNAIAALGISKYGFKNLAGRILTALMDVSEFVDLHRLPELLCGLSRRRGEGPTRYPVACAPQAWSAGAVFMVLEACLGMTMDAPKKQLILDQPFLPPVISRLTVRQLELAGATVDLFLERTGDTVKVETLEKKGEIDVIVR